MGTAYEPVRLGKPGKLGNRFPFGQNAEPEPEPAPVSRPRPSGGGLTWSQRQEQAKKQKEEEEAKTREAVSKAAVGAGAGATIVGAGAAAVRSAVGDPNPPPPPPPAPPVADPVAQVTSDLQQTKLDEGTAEALAAPGATAGSTGKRAVVVYDYEAAEDNELALVEGETITSIEMIDEGWWSGIGPNGQEGLFPATCELS